MSDLNIGKVIIDQTKTSQVTVNYADTSKPDTSTITSNRTQMTATVDSISTVFEVSKTYYFDADGGLVTTNQGYGTLGTTDSDGVLTVAHSTPSLALTAPSEGTKYELEESFNVTWTSSNITLVNIILESESGGYKIYSNINASLGTLAVAISASDGFSINETVSIYIENTHQSIDDSVHVQSIATLTINSPTLTAGVEGNVTGTSNGVEVDVYYRVSSPEGAWQVFEEGVAVSGGNWSATGTIADADTYDFIAEDTTDRDGSAQVDDVVVASGTYTGMAMYVGCNPTAQFGKVSADGGSTWSTIDTSQLTYDIAVINDGSFAYFAGRNNLIKVTKAGVASILKQQTGKGFTFVKCNGDGKYILIGVQDYGIYRSDDYGATWTLVTSSAGTTAFISQSGQIQMYFLAGRPYYSSDYGATWTIKDSTNRNWLSCCGSDDGSIIYAIDFNNEKLWKITNAGSTFTSVASGRSFEYISCSIDGTIVTCSIYNNSSIWYSLNSGASGADHRPSGWAKLMKYIGLDILDGSKLLAPATNGGVYMSQSPYSSNGSLVIDDTHTTWMTPVISGNYGIVVRSGKVYYTVDGGANWSDMSSAGIGICGMNITRD